MPGVPGAWRMTGSQAAPAEFFARTLGFTIGTEDPILLTDGDGGSLESVGSARLTFR